MEILNASKIRDLLFPIYSSVGLRYQPGSVFELVITLQHAVMELQMFGTAALIIATVVNFRRGNCNCLQLPPTLACGLHTDSSGVRTPY